MKWINAVVCTTLLTLAGPVLGNETPVASPQDYAFGVTLGTSTPSQWYRIALPQDVYQQSASPELQDVRVFNQRGEAVPFSLVKAARQQAASEPTALRLFPLDSSPVTSRQTTEDDTDKILLRSKSGVEIVLEGEKAKPVGQHYLLTLPEKASEAVSLSQLQLAWDTPQTPWQGKASVYYSVNLKRWHSLREEMPLMDIASGNDRLKLDRIDVDITLSPHAIRYLLLVLEAPRATVALTGVKAVSAPAHVVAEQMAMQGEGRRLSATEAQWQWTRPQPLSSLDITLNSDGVLPVEIAWRSTAKSDWQVLKKEVLYQLEGRASAPVPLPGTLVEAIKITTLNARLPETLPQVTGYRDRYDLVFNAQGKAPYLLAWGNGAAEPASVGVDMLIPADLRTTYDVATLPSASVNEAVKLGGESRLTATPATERESQAKQLLVWGVLIVGVALLALLAFRLWREVKNDGAA